MGSKRQKLRSLFPAMRPKLMAIPGGPRVHAPTDMLGPEHFKIAIFIAVAVHIVLIIAWQFLPKQKVVEVPVHTLSIKLGDGGAVLPAEKLDALAPDGENQDDVEATLAHLVRDTARDAARADSITGTMEKAMGVEAQDAKEPLTQFVRKPAVEAKPSATSTEQKEIVTRYEKLIGLWVQKFQVYPEELRGKNIDAGTTARLQIDRQGNIRNFALEGSTGTPDLDRSAIEMIRRANPVPAVPIDYPAGETFEFTIPISFKQ